MIVSEHIPITGTQFHPTIEGEAVKYKSSLDAFNQILKNEGAKSLFKGAGANILRAIAGAGVLSGYDKLQPIVFGKKYGSGGD